MFFAMRCNARASDLFGKELKASRQKRQAKRRQDKEARRKSKQSLKQRRKNFALKQRLFGSR